MADEAGSPGVFPAEHPSERSSASLIDPSMPEEIAQPDPRPSRWKRRVTLASLLIVVLAAAVVLPPLINISRYQRQITALVSRSLGRPVHLSGVELRLLPRPGFVLHNLSVSEDPEFGAEPILSAATVVASIHIFSLWRGKLEVDRISVDEASLNLVRSSRGRWNLQSLMMGGLMDGIDGRQPSNAPSSAQPAVSRKPAPFPYLAATNSRVNLKNGQEKSPFSLVGTQLSLWQDAPGAWRLRLRGQPVRTDMEISLADTGEVRIEASMQTSSPAHELRSMPLKLQAEWRDAQLGQLSRLLLGSDAGWRGDLTADMDVQGTPDAAETKARLRATGVRREEFAPDTPLDFDANCSFRYEHSHKAVHNLGCDTAIGSGLLHLKADLPGNSGNPEAVLGVKQLPLQAGLDLLRTVRSGFAPGIVAQGTANGSLSLLPASASPADAETAARHRTTPRQSSRDRKNETANPAAGALSLQGSLTVTDGLLKGGQLKQSLPLPRMTWAPTQVPVPEHSGSFEAGLASRFTLSLGPEVASPEEVRPEAAPTPAPASGPSARTTPPAADAAQPSSTRPRTPPAVPRLQEILVRLVLTAQGYEASLGGSASSATLRNLAYAFGAPHLDAANSFSSGTADIDLTAAGPWIAFPDTFLAETLPASGLTASPPPSLSTPASDLLSGSFQVHHAEWRAPYLARGVELPQAKVTLSATAVSMTSDFVYGALKGSMLLNAPVHCKATDCQPELQIHLGAVDTRDLEGALLGAPEKKTLLSPLIDRMRSSDRPKWPAMTVTVQADSLTLGPTTLRKPSLRMKMEDTEIDLKSWEAGVLDGSARGTGHCSWTDNGLKYSIDGDFEKISPASLSALLNGHSNNPGEESPGGPESAPSSASPKNSSETSSETSNESRNENWSGGAISGSGSIQLSGLTSQQLAASATGTVHFSWPHGSIPSPTTPGTELRFDDWSGIATIGNAKAQLAENTMRQAKRSTSLAGAFPFGGPPKLAIAPTPAKPAASSNPPRPHAPPPPAVQ
jgi:hypothetical protein